MRIGRKLEFSIKLMTNFLMSLRKMISNFASNAEDKYAFLSSLKVWDLQHLKDLSKANFDLFSSKNNMKINP